MRRVAIGAVVAALALGGGAATADNSATLHVVNVGGPAHFLTLDLSPSSFDLGPGQARHFRRLKPGTYVVVQAPPLPGPLQIVCSNGEAIEVHLAAGDDVTCTYVHE